jgi:Na+/H+-dicarboxylate symporter
MESFTNLCRISPARLPEAMSGKNVGILSYRLSFSLGTKILIFTAQATGVEFSLTSQITVVLIGLLLSTGSGGIPGGGLVVALIFVKAFHLPLEIAVIVAGIYRLIDMGGTTINCMGDLVGTVIVTHSERKLELKKT